ncbi:Vitamin B12 ABC transporter, permease component BtuC [invertebrate metagenome]|uniref:Vitamin B12 ABC transporter, permease component BtuC n=1 Tax=invertebrate metagenome TaxID=1711999 RepID=A0A484HAQ1_9ZZZZ
MIGAALGASGAALQGLLRNPLAEPGLLGTSASAGLGAVLALYYGWAAVFPLALPIAAISTSAVGTLVLLLAAGWRAGSLTLILAGIAVSSLTLALTALAMNLASDPFAMGEMVLWLMGSLKDRSLEDVALAAPFVATGLVLLHGSGRGLDALTLGEDAAASLGIDMLRLRCRVVLGSALAVGAAVAVAGTVGFVGLIVPHLLRPLVRHYPSALLLPSALGGALLVTVADIAVRLIPARNELMLGVLTSLVGTPFFLFLIFKEAPHDRSLCE